MKMVTSLSSLLVPHPALPGTLMILASLQSGLETSHSTSRDCPATLTTPPGLQRSPPLMLGILMTYTTILRPLVTSPRTRQACVCGRMSPAQSTFPNCYQANMFMALSSSFSTYSPRPTTTPLMTLTSLVMMLILRHCLVLSPGLRLIQARGKGSSFACGVFPAPPET